MQSPVAYRTAASPTHHASYHYSDAREVIRDSSALLLCALSTRALVVQLRLLLRKLLERQVGNDIPRVADADDQEQHQPRSDLLLSLSNRLASRLIHGRMLCTRVRILSGDARCIKVQQRQGGNIQLKLPDVRRAY
jgi:hypothetical protein